MLTLQSEHPAQQPSQTFRGTHNHDTHTSPPFSALTVSGWFILCEAAVFCAKKDAPAELTRLLIHLLNLARSQSGMAFACS